MSSIGLANGSDQALLYSGMPAPILVPAGMRFELAVQFHPLLRGLAHGANLHRFQLTPADVKDTQGAPDIAVDGDGRVHLTWASITGETEPRSRFESS